LGGGRAWKRWIRARDAPRAAACSNITASSRAEQPRRALPTRSKPMLRQEPGSVPPASLSSPQRLKSWVGFITSEGVRAPAGHPAAPIPPRFFTLNSSRSKGLSEEDSPPRPWLACGLPFPAEAIAALGPDG